MKALFEGNIGKQIWIKCKWNISLVEILEILSSLIT